MNALTAWESFYIIVGSSAGALIGLQFVVITLISELPVAPNAAMASRAFSTPGIIHFIAVLFLSAVISAPWEDLGVVSVIWVIVGIAGAMYVIIIGRRMRKQTIYKPVFEDWLFHVLLPFAAYTALAVSSYISRTNERQAMFVVGTSSIILLFIGIHNAWDIVTYHVFTKRSKTGEF